jgi:hypothetical protein
MKREGTGVLFFDDNFENACWAELSPKQIPESYRAYNYKNLTDVVRSYIVRKVSIDSWEELMR